ncbi:hypothetical protein BS47DRAFT_1365594 [Hydnum rufescens UP504]|uniref:Uncharacterized protein n=1 Tax=Hydnum rufescens UP504 TaxID=1448309 RepID=A0A9P6ANF0_9AGAM|nr:hypothetical protein BS47DRAFT_1365594 [Hydnum rufescens UP504]
MPKEQQQLLFWCCLCCFFTNKFVILDPFSLRETPAELSTDEAQGEIRGRAQPPRTPTLTYPQPPQQQIKYGAAHPLQQVCGNPGSGPFSLRETDLKNAQTTSTAKYGSAQPPKTPTRTLYDNETSTAPHTRFGGDLHYVIPDPTNAQARLRAKHRSAQPPRPPNPQVPATYMTTNQIRCQTPALAGSFSLHQTRQGRNMGAHAATQDPNLRLPTIYMNQTWCHTPTEAGVVVSGLPSLQNDDIPSHPEPCLRAKTRPEGPVPKRPQPTQQWIKHGTTHPLRQPTHEAILLRAQICQSARISCMRVCTTMQMNEVTEEKESHTHHSGVAIFKDLIQPTTAPTPKQNPADKDTTRKPTTRPTEHPQE